MKKFKELSEEKQAIIIYSGELLIFSIVFIVLGVLRIVGIIGYNDTRRIVFNYITLLAGLWTIIEFIWILVSPKKRKKSCILDKIVVLPLSIFMITYDLISLIKNPSDLSFYQYCLGAAICYGGVALMFQAIYHYFNPLPAIIEEVKKAKEQAEKEEQEKLLKKENEEGKEN